MAAKNIKEALLRADIKNLIGMALCIGPAHELVVRIDLAEKKILQNVLYELRDYLSHQAQYADDKDQSVLEFFNHVFEGIGTHRSGDDEH
jgi:hypothetical protein